MHIERPVGGAGAQETGPAVVGAPSGSPPAAPWRSGTLPDVALTALSPSLPPASLSDAIRRPFQRRHRGLSAVCPALTRLDTLPPRNFPEPASTSASSEAG